MTKKEIENILTEKAAGYGFKLVANGVGWNAERTDIGYISIFITEAHNEDKTDWESRKVRVDIKARANVSHMGGNPMPEDLISASDEISRAAKLVTDIQSMSLSYIAEF